MKYNKKKSTNQIKKIDNKMTDYIEVCKYIMGYSFSLNWYLTTSTLPKPFKHRFKNKNDAIKMKKSLYNLFEVSILRQLTIYCYSQILI